MIFDVVIDDDDGGGGGDGDGADAGAGGVGVAVATDSDRRPMANRWRPVTQFCLIQHFNPVMFGQWKTRQ